MDIDSSVITGSVIGVTPMDVENSPLGVPARSVRPLGPRRAVSHRLFAMAVADIKPTRRPRLGASPNDSVATVAMDWTPGDPGESSQRPVKSSAGSRSVTQGQVDQQVSRLLAAWVSAFRRAFEACEETLKDGSS